MFRNMRLQARLLFFYSVLIIVSVATLGLIAYKENVSTAEANFTNIISGNLSVTGNNLYNLFHNVEKQAQLFVYGYVVQDVLSNNEDESAAKQYDDYLSLESTIRTFEKNENFFRIQLFLHKQNMFLNDRINFFYDEKPFAEEGSNLLVSYKQSRWIANKDEAALEEQQGLLFSYVMDIISIRNITDLLGYASFDIKEETVREYIRSLDTPALRNVRLLHESGKELTAMNGSGGGKSRIPGEVIEQFRSKSSGSMVARIGSAKSLYIYQKIYNYPFVLLAEIPTEEIRSQSRLILQKFVVISVIILFISFLIANLISAGISKRVKRLVQAMGTLEENDFRVRVPVTSEDEIGILSAKFNWMVERIVALIDDVYKTGLEKKETELHLLQSQINPHFLYNTLDSINWLATKHNAPEINYMIRNLSDFFRLSLNVDREVTIETELHHLRAYFSLQKYRFEDRISLAIDIPEELFDYKIVSIVLQPLAENAILHGILKEEGRKGTICVRGELADDLIILEVQDNGIGIPGDRLRQIVEQMKTSNPPDLGKGLRNVHQRIKFHYGEDYGLNIISEHCVGTNCILVFPAVK